MMIRQCKRCLLKDMDGEEYFRTVYEYIESLDPQIRTPEPEYQRRLSICRECDDLVNGMCRLCGCFVESRAAKIHSRCAQTPEKAKKNIRSWIPPPLEAGFFYGAVSILPEPLRIFGFPGIWGRKEQFRLKKGGF